jgi:hypothetical protein
VSLLDRVRDATGGDLWSSVNRFRGYVGVKGLAVAQLQQAYSLGEVVAEGNIAAASVRMSGFAQATDWCVYPEFVAIRHGDGRFLGVRRPKEGCFRCMEGALEQIYLCGVSVWMCMTAPLIFLNSEAAFEELDDWVSGGQTLQRLKVFAPPHGLAPARETIMYFDRDGLVHRVDFDSRRYDGDSVTIYSSAHCAMGSLTLPTLYRALRRSPDGKIINQPPLLDIEIFDATYA